MSQALWDSVRRRSATRLAKRLAIAAVVLAVLFSAALRIRLADVPFERDEGEYVCAALFTPFGETPRGVHPGLLLVDAATTLFVFLLGRRLLVELGGAVAACAFALLSLARWIMGIFAHATRFVALPVTAALWLLLRTGRAATLRAALVAGGLLGVAVLLKQHAIVYLPFAAVLIAWQAS